MPAAEEHLHERPCAHVLHRGLLRELAAARTLSRGRIYYQSGRVLHAVRRSAKLSGTVRGTLDYPVTIWIHGSSLAWTCTCPQSVDGILCKHAVALAFAWLEQSPA